MTLSVQNSYIHTYDIMQYRKIYLSNKCGFTTLCRTSSDTLGSRQTVKTVQAGDSDKQICM